MQTAFKIVKTIITPFLSLAILFLLGIAIASWIKETTFTTEWANMLAWFALWAK